MKKKCIQEYLLKLDKNYDFVIVEPRPVSSFPTPSLAIWTLQTRWVQPRGTFEILLLAYDVNLTQINS